MDGVIYSGVVSGTLRYQVTQEVNGYAIFELTRHAEYDDNEANLIRWTWSRDEAIETAVETVQSKRRYTDEAGKSL